MYVCKYKVSLTGISGLGTLTVDSWKACKSTEKSRAEGDEEGERLAHRSR